MSLPKKLLSMTAMSAAVVFALANGAQAQQAAAQTKPAAAAPTKDEPQTQVQKEREWLVAYLIAHQGYRVDQMDELVKRLDKMSPTQVQTLVDLYQQKHEMALQREQQNMEFRKQMLAVNQQQRSEQVAQQNRYIQEQDAGANQEQQRLNEQQQQVLQGYQERKFESTPYGYGAGYGAYGAFGYGPYYDRYWH